MGFIDFLKKRTESKDGLSSATAEVGDHPNLDLEIPPIPDISPEVPQPPPPPPPPNLRNMPSRTREQEPFPHRGDIPPISIAPRSHPPTYHQPPYQPRAQQPYRQEPPFPQPSQQNIPQQPFSAAEEPFMEEGMEDNDGMDSNTIESNNPLDDKTPQLEVPSPVQPRELQGRTPYVMVPSSVPGENPIPIVPPSLQQKRNSLHHKKGPRPVPLSESLDVFSGEEDNQEQGVQRIQEQRVVPQRIVPTGPQFVTVTDFRSVLQGMEEGSALLTKAGDDITQINNIDTEKEDAVAALKTNLGELQKRFLVIDGILFREGN